MTAAGDLRGGIDLGGTKIQTAIVGPRGGISGQARRPTPTEGGPEDVAREMAEALREAAEQAGIATSDLAGVGVGSPGDADEKTGVVSAAKNLPGWDGSFPLAENLSEALGTDVRIGNDVQVATEAEFHLGAGKPYESLIGVFWGTGVGGGLILGRRAVAGPGRGGRDRPYGGEAKRGAMPLRAAGLPGGLCGTGGDGGQGPARAGGRRRDGPVQDHEAPRPGPADQRRLGARPARQGPPRREPDQTRDPLPRDRDRLRGQPARRRVRDHRRRPRGALRRAFRRADRGGDGQAPVLGRPPPEGPGRRARRPGRRDRRLAAVPR